MRITKRGLSSEVERDPSKFDATGSNPVVRSTSLSQRKMNKLSQPITVQTKDWLSRGQIENYMRTWKIGAHKERIIYQICKQACEYDDLRNELASVR
jgi:hypothetical protein